MPTSATLSSTPRLSEYAKSFVYPATICRTVWPRVEAKGAEIGLGFDWWQSQAGTVILGYRADGKYAATVGGVGMSIPRQVGKTYFVLAMLVCLCLLFRGLQVIWTAHHLRTSTKTFTALRGICRRKKIAPHVLALRSANGEQQATFRNGSVIMFGARSQGFGRGFDEIDIEVFDEAQIMDSKALEDMIAATNQARHEHGALLFFMGTPPRPTDPSEAFTLRRSEALSGEAEDAVWLEIGADPASDPNDRAQWPLMNPSFPFRTPEESLLRLRKNLGDNDSWNREGRGIWDPKTGEDQPLAGWLSCIDHRSERPSQVAIGFSVLPDLSRAQIAVVGRRPDGATHGELVDVLEGTGRLVPRLVELCRRWSPCAVAMNNAGAGKAFLPSLAEAGILPDPGPGQWRLQPLGAGDYAAASMGLASDVLEGVFRHPDDPVLAAAALSAKRRPLSLGWAFVDDSGLVEAVAVARHAFAQFAAEPETRFFGTWR